MRNAITTFLFAFIACNFSFAQDKTSPDTLQLWKVETVDENVYVGEILFQNADTVRLKTAVLGVISIPKNQIMLMRTVTEELYTKERGHTPYASRYFFSPNAYNLKKGEGYYQNSLIFYNQASVGFSDRFSMGVGVVPIFFFGGAPTPVWITPKVSFPIQEEKINIAAGALVGYVIGASESLFGIVYGTSTFGSKDRNWTLGAGYGFLNGELAESPAITLGGVYRLGKRSYFLTENYFIGFEGGGVGLLSAGGRWAGRKVGIDYG
ncbi:MAG: hypothetical protein AAF599_10960, partial [Bacteroidota bacterium]